MTRRMLILISLLFYIQLLMAQSFDINAFADSTNSAARNTDPLVVCWLANCPQPGAAADLITQSLSELASISYSCSRSRRLSNS